MHSFAVATWAWKTVTNSKKYYQKCVGGYWPTEFWTYKYSRNNDFGARIIFESDCFLLDLFFGIWRHGKTKHALASGRWAAAFRGQVEVVSSWLAREDQIREDRNVCRLAAGLFSALGDFFWGSWWLLGPQLLCFFFLNGTHHHAKFRKNIWTHVFKYKGPGFRSNARGSLHTARRL